MRRSIAVAAIFCLSHTTVAFAAEPLLASAMRAARQFGQTERQPKQQVELFGVGATVKVKLASREKLEGSIVAIDAESFDLASRREGLRRRITYGEVTELKFAKKTYKSSGPPNATEAKRVAAGLIGGHVAVKMPSGTTLRGHVQEVSGDHFVLLLDQAARPFEIPYGEVQELGPNLSTTAKTALWVGVGLAVATAILVAMEVNEEETI